MSKIVIILSPPHVGSSILKCMLGKCQNVNEIINEGKEIPKNEIMPNKVNLIKYPLFYPNESNIDPSYIKILLLRKPKYALSSLKKRFKGKEIPENHKKIFTVEYWENFFDYFINSGNKTVKYEQIFSKKFMKLLCDDLAIGYTDNMYGQYDRRVVQENGIPTKEPERTNHVDFRHFQINQPIKNMNSDDNLDVDECLIKEIESLKTYSKIWHQ